MTKPCTRCKEPMQYKNNIKLYCEPCRKAVRVEATQKWVQSKDEKSLSNIDKKYTRRTV